MAGSVDRLAATFAIVMLAAGPVLAVCDLVVRRVRRWRLERWARLDAERFLDGCDLDLAVKQLFVQEGCYFGEWSEGLVLSGDDLMLLADEVQREVEP